MANLILSSLLLFASTVTAARGQHAFERVKAHGNHPGYSASLDDVQYGQTTSNHVQVNSDYKSPYLNKNTESEKIMLDKTIIQLLIWIS